MTLFYKIIYQYGVYFVTLLILKTVFKNFHVGKCTHSLHKASFVVRPAEQGIFLSANNSVTGFVLTKILALLDLVQWRSTGDYFPLVIFLLPLNALFGSRNFSECCCATFFEEREKISNPTYKISCTDYSSIKIKKTTKKKLHVFLRVSFSHTRYFGFEVSSFSFIPFSEKYRRSQNSKIPTPKESFMGRSWADSWELSRISIEAIFFASKRLLAFFRGFPHENRKSLLE